ncbi:hypothetical protein HOLleu_32474 [Holothuria leucospilota]|uniref:Endonuclease-reverse transcriptase n=1 Tax=Holothuria leucospilota TaxID=206669 RepID=A0A9Q1BIR1_HOLLE|nr:hypothetical protein HOLleu_32474 [Holothuria leucospilota]
MHDDLRSLEINFEKAIEFFTKRVEDLESREKLNSDRIKALEDEVQKMKQVDLEQADRINVQERFSRRSNTRIVGFPCTENESCEGIVKSVMEKVGVSNVRIERAHRDGRLNPTRPRHILAKLSFYQDKITALKHQRRALENEPFFITDDLTKRDLQEKRKWASQVTQLYNQGTKLRFSAGKWRDSSGGDFNLVMNLDLDKTGGLPRTNFRARSKLIEIMNRHDLIDIWRERNLQSKSFTWHSNIDDSIHCRLDFFIISNHMKNLVANTLITSLFGSDHSSVSVTLRIGTIRGKGMWKLNTSLLGDPVYIDLIKRTIADTLNSDKGENVCLLWEACKVNIRSVSISYSKSLTITRRRDEQNLLDQISKLEQQNANFPSVFCHNKLTEARAALEALYDYKLKGTVVRSRARWSEEGEKNTKYFLNLEKRNRSMNSINELILSSGISISAHSDIMGEVKRFYSELYTKQNGISSIDFCSNHSVPHNKVSPEQQLVC